METTDRQNKGREGSDRGRRDERRRRSLSRDRRNRDERRRRSTSGDRQDRDERRRRSISGDRRDRNWRRQRSYSGERRDRIDRQRSRSRDTNERRQREDRYRPSRGRFDSDVDGRDYKKEDDGRREYRRYTGGERERRGFSVGDRNGRLSAERGTRNEIHSRDREGHRGDHRMERKRDSSNNERRGRRDQESESQRYEWGTREDREKEDEKEKKTEVEVEPDFGLSGALAEETNKVAGVALKYVEPEDAAIPSMKWRLYTFKNGEPLGDPLPLHRQTSYLFGRERKVADIPTDHPSCSKQQAVIQYRKTIVRNQKAIRPYLMDLNSTNGSFINNEKIESQKYYELMEKDLIKFGNSSRDYVLLNSESM